jgi:hypothetical protein
MTTGQLHQGSELEQESDAHLSLHMNVAARQINFL